MTPSCRFCGEPLERTVVDLGTSPLSNAFLSGEQLRQPEVHFPLRVYVCEKCLLVQLPESEKPDEIFSDDYAYFSSYSDSWMEHSKAYVDHMMADYGIGTDDFVVEVASNDGYLLRYFVDAGVPVLGIDPAQNVAEAAEAVGVPTLVEFFGTDLARELVRTGRRADLLIGNNVLAHVPNLNGFVEGLRIVLAPEGTLTMEFPHLLQLMEKNEFDTIYHEHFSYFSLLAVERIFSSHGLTIFDVEEIPTHGGSLRIYARRDTDQTRPVTDRVHALRDREIKAGLSMLATYDQFGERVEKVKRHLLQFLLHVQEQGETVVGYGAPAKGNTLLNYCGVRSDLLSYTVDRNPHKQDHFLPGTHIPVYAPDKIMETRPDYVLILPWNLEREIFQQMEGIAEWGGQFVVPIPDVRIIDPASDDRDKTVDRFAPSDLRLTVASTSTGSAPQTQRQ